MPEGRASSIVLRRWVKILASVLAVLLLMVWEHIEALRLERQVEPMKREADRFTYENARLQMQINQYVAPSHLDAMAKKDLKMGPADSAHIIGLEVP